MAYINNGTNRSLYITVNKQVGGNQVQGYPVTYNGQNAFPGYLILTDEEVRQLSSGDFNTRYLAFVAYVESVEDGVEFDTDIVGDGATKYDPDVCLATTTTTYTTLAPVYGFSVKYGEWPVDACAGTLTTVYSDVQAPGVGDFLYKDVALTEPWDTVKGSSILFLSPMLYADEVVGVAIVDTPTYDLGEIMLLTGLHCDGIATTTTTEAPVPTTTTTSTTTAAPEYYYTLYRCDTEAYYQIGPFASSSLFSTGMRVEGATSVYYVVTSVTTTNPAYTTITGATFTGYYGCP
jgi:hypothetical protein